MSWILLHYLTVTALLFCVTALTLHDRSTSYLCYSNSVTLRSLALQFRTQVSDSLLVYQDSGSASSDYILIQLIGGRLDLSINIFASNELVNIPTSIQVNDDMWHSLELSINSSAVLIAVDGKKQSRNLLAFNPNSDVYIGGLPSWYSLPSIDSLLRFVGCIQTIKILGIEVEPVESAGTKPGCVNACDSSPCTNGGVCSNYYSHFTCDCLYSKSGGSQCEQISRPVSFEGAQYIQYDAQYKPLPIQPIDLQLFLTTSWPNGLILLTQSSQSNYIALELKDGKLVFSYINNNVAILTINSVKVADNKRHRIRVYRRQSAVNIDVDNATVSTGNLASTTSHLVIDQSVFVGGTLSLIFTKSVSLHGFVGCLQQVTLNGVDITSLMTSSSGQEISIKGQVSDQCRDDYSVSVNFPNGDSGVMINDWIKGWNDGTWSLSFEFRTLELHAELVYTATRYQTKQFEARISHSHIQVTLPSDIMVIPMSVNDGLWHSFNITYNVDRFVINVDGMSKTSANPYATSFLSSFQSEPLFLGKKESVAGSAVSIEHSDIPGFTGCVRDLRIRGEAVDVFSVIERQPSMGRVFVGDCQAEDACKARRCRNGQCVRKYNGFECNCTGTGYTGFTCQQALPSDTITLRKLSSSLSTSLPNLADDHISASIEFRTTAINGQLISFSQTANLTPHVALAILSYNTVSLTLIDQLIVFQVFVEVLSGVANGKWHVAQIAIDSASMALSVDAETQIKYFSSEWILLAPHIAFIGKSLSRHPSQPNKSIPGCFRNLLFGSDCVDLAQASTSQSAVDIEKGCSGSCLSQPCLHSGVCIEGWGSFKCDCSRTQFTGVLCESARPSLSLQANSSLTIGFPSSYTPTTFRDDLKFGFLALNPQTTGTLLSVYSSLTKQYILVQLRPWHFIAKLILQNGDGGVVDIPGNFTDGAEYVVHIQRQGHGVHITVTVTEMDGHSHRGTLSGQYLSFEKHNQIAIGLIPHTDIVSNVSTRASFEGCVWGIDFNNVRPLEWIDSDVKTSQNYDGFSLNINNIKVNSCGSEPIPNTPPPVTTQTYTTSEMTTIQTNPTSNQVSPPTGQQQNDESGKSLIIIAGATAGGVVTLLIIGVVVYKCVKKRDSASYSVEDNATASYKHRKDSDDLPDITPYDVEGKYADNPGSEEMSRENAQPNGQMTLTRARDGHRPNRYAWNSNSPPTPTSGQTPNSGQTHQSNKNSSSHRNSSNRRSSSGNRGNHTLQWSPPQRGQGGMRNAQQHLEEQQEPQQWFL